MSKSMRHYAAMSMLSGGEQAENRFRDRRGREHYDDGRFAPMRSEMRDTVYPQSRMPGRNVPVRSGGYMMEDYNWPVYGNSTEMNYEPDMRGDSYRMNQIGFMAHGGTHMAGHMEPGYGSGSSGGMDKATAERWVRNLGQSWTLDQAKQVMTRYGYACDPLEFWVALNMMQSDYSRVAAVCGADKEEFYAAMAHAFLDDKDAMPDKLSRYYHAVVKKDM